MKFIYKHLLLVLLVSVCVVPWQAQAKETRPNIIVILADDMGYSDVGAFGGEINTPNLDELAYSGLRLSEFYNSARCWPTRASLITGRYAEAIGPQQTSIAKVLKTAGYQTGMVGKWHLSKKPKGPFAPIQQGFDAYYGTMGGAGSFYEPPFLTRNTEFIQKDSEDYYYTNAMSKEAVLQIETFAKSTKPFFQYLAYTAPHWPMHAPEHMIQKYLKTYQVGWDEIRQQRYTRMLELGVIGRHTTPLPPKESVVSDWKDMNHKEWRARNMAIYAAMVEIMDQSIGKVVNALKRTGQYDNTLIMFLSDNGAANKVINKIKGKEGFDFTQVIGGKESWGSVGPNWANAQNTPFRFYKNNAHQGGALTSAIMHWPAGLKTTAGGITRQRGHVVDIMATAIDLADAKYPNIENGHHILPTEGISLTPILYGDTIKREQPYYFKRGGKTGSSVALIVGDYKVVRERDEPWELYNLKQNFSETHDLADKFPQLTAEMAAKWKQKKWLHPRPKNHTQL